jgi:hypothetical protein
LFRDAFHGAALADDVLRVQQGRIEIILRPLDRPDPPVGTAGPPPGR